MPAERLCVVSTPRDGSESDIFGMSSTKVPYLVTNKDRLGGKKSAVVKHFPELYPFTKQLRVARIMLNQRCVLPPKNLANVTG